MANEVAKRSPVNKLKDILSNEGMKQQFQNALRENSGAFIASIIDLYGSDQYLQKCDPAKVAMEALKAATLKLPINKQLGFAYIVPFKNQSGESVPTFTIGYKGYTQLAMRTGQYRYLNSGIIYEGQEVERDYLTGEVKIIGEPSSDKAVGYFTYMQLLNGFSKTVYMTKEEVTAHAKRYSKSYNRSTSAWKTNFDEMAMKTTTRLLLSKFGILSTEMITALSSDLDDDPEGQLAREVENEANSEVIDIEATEAADQQEEHAAAGPDF